MSENSTILNKEIISNIKNAQMAKLRRTQNIEDAKFDFDKNVFLNPWLLE
ncbi:MULTISPECIES: hypothetical protein [unclassified Campylobacter]|nr:MULTISPECIES: hypothetical protein [unclassified Campylobacter]